MSLPIANLVYCVNPGILSQKDLALAMHEDLVAAVLDLNNIDLPDGEESVMMLSNRGEMFELNLVGAVIWEMIDAGKQVGVIVETVTRAFEVDASTASAHVEQLIANLLKSGLISQK